MSAAESLARSLRVSTSIRSVPREWQAPGPPTSGLRAPELMGRLAELVGSGDGTAGQLSVAVGLLQEVQAAGEPVAWIHSTAPPPYPPDLAERGVDLESLAVVRVAGRGGAGRGGAGDRAMLRAADQLLRSGAFGLVVLDYLKRPLAPLAAQVRLAGLCRQHHCALLCLGPEPAFPMASLRARVERSRATGPSGKADRYVCTVEVDKDKRRGRQWRYEQHFDGPVGMR